MLKANKIAQGFCLGLVLAIFLVGAARAERIVDVPPEHWAYAAIQRLIDEGYLTLYSDGTFRGQNPVDRFTFAGAIARLWEEMEGKAGEATTSDVELLRKLTGEFRSELVALLAQSDELKHSLEQIKANSLIAQEELTLVTAANQEARAEMAKIAAELLETKTNVDQFLANFQGIKTQMASMEENLTAMETKVNSFINNLSSAKTDIDSVQQQLAEAKALIEAELIRQKQTLTELQANLKEFGAEAKQFSQITDALEHRAADLDARLAESNASLTAYVNELQNGLSRLETAVNEIETRLHTAWERSREELELRIAAERRATLIREEELAAEIKSLANQLAELRLEQQAFQKASNRKLAYSWGTSGLLFLLLLFLK